MNAAEEKRLRAAARHAGRQLGRVLNDAVKEGVSERSLQRGIINFLVGLARDRNDLASVHDDLKAALAEHCD